MKRVKKMKKENMEVECCESVHIHDGVIEQVKRGMPKQEDLKELADFFKVFGDGTRIRILYALLSSEMCVCDLAELVIGMDPLGTELLEMSQSAISHQLRVLKQMKLVKNRRDGKTVYYSLADGHIQTIMSQGMEHIKE